MEKLIIFIIIFISFVLLIKHLRKAAKREDGCQGCAHQNKCKS
ncbi:MAG: FeoB-associated Cys-rich membrane protein [Candidatus Moranbacteria bacterium]|nr:FeoB-associated Cys-rich membrane protein [Candidatus Moranbacteria bacterium]